MALGFVVIYKATGVINFAQGALVTLGAYLAYNFHQTWGFPSLALVIAVRARASSASSSSDCCCVVWSGDRFSASS